MAPQRHRNPGHYVVRHYPATALPSTTQTLILPITTTTPTTRAVVLHGLASQRPFLPLHNHWSSVNLLFIRAYPSNLLFYFILLPIHRAFFWSITIYCYVLRLQTVLLLLFASRLWSLPFSSGAISVYFNFFRSYASSIAPSHGTLSSMI